MSRLRRISLLFLCVALLMAFLAFPVSAATRSTVVNFLDAVEYEHIDANGVSTVNSAPAFTVSGGQNTFKWKSASAGPVEKVVLTFSIWAGVSGITLNGIAPTSGLVFDKTYSYLQAEFDLGTVWQKYNWNEFELVMTFTAGDFEFGIDSCIGYLNNSHSIDAVVFTFREQYLDPSGLLQSSFKQVDYAALPYQYWYNFVPSPSKLSPAGCNVIVKIPKNQFIFHSLDSIVVSFLSTDAPTFTAGLYSDNDVVEGLPVEEITVMYTGRDVVVGNQVHQMFYQEYCVDLSSADLVDRGIMLSFSLDTIFSTGFESDNEGLCFELFSIDVIMPYEEQPWYTVFTSWLGDQFNSLKNAISGIFTGDTSAVDKITGDLQESAGALDQAGTAMDSVSKPSAGDITASIDSVLGGVDIDLYGGHLGSFFDSAALSSMMITVAVLSLCSYALFGKKG